MTAKCPICDVELHCPCPDCRAKEPPGPALPHYGYRSGRDGKSDVLCCPNCGFSGPINEFKMT